MELFPEVMLLPLEGSRLACSKRLGESVARSEPAASMVEQNIYRIGIGFAAKAPKALLPALVD